jgi:hypothetical protein
MSHEAGALPEAGDVMRLGIDGMGKQRQVAC